MTAKPTPAPQPDSSTASLSLPATHFAKLSPHAFLAAHLPSTRPSRRAPSEARAPTIHTGSLTHAHGSAIVRLGSTAVVCGVRGEILNARDANAMTVLGADGSRGSTKNTGGRGCEMTKDADAIADLGLLVPNIELATGCNPQHMPGNPPSTLAQSLTQRVLTLLRITDLVPLRDLQIWTKGEEGRRRGNDNSGSGKEDDGDGDGDDDEDMSDGSGHGERELSSAAGIADSEPGPRAFWTLYIDILVISLDGCAFDAAWGAVLAALKDTMLPSAWWDGDREGVLCDPRIEHVRKLSIRGCPVALSFALFSPPVGARVAKEGKGGDGRPVYVLADPDDFEEGCCAQGITVVVDESGMRVMRLEMGGGDLLDWREVRGLVGRTGERSEEWKAVLGVE